MATRRPLFHNEIDFSPEEVAYTDAIRVGKVLLDGVGGIAIDGGHTLASNFQSPVSPDDLATKSYVDAVAAGLDPHMPVYVKTDNGLGLPAITVPTGTGSGSMVGLGGVGFTLAVNGGAATPFVFTGAPDPTNMAAVLAQIEAAFPTVIATEAPASNVTITSRMKGKNASLALSAVHATVTTNLGVTATGSPWAGTGFTAAGAGPGKTLTAPSSSTTFNTIDGKLLTVGQRVLVANEQGVDTTADVDNGIYTVTTLGNGGANSFTLTRATDADQHAPNLTELHQGTYVFVTDGTLGANTSWTCVTADPITVDAPSATAIMWGQFGGAPTLTYDQGLKRITSSIQVDLDTGANAQGTGAAGGSSGLEFDADTAAGKLRAKVDPVKGITRNANGLGLLIQGTTLEFEGTNPTAGLRVKGLPNLFEIGGNATSQTPGAGQVTAGALNTITAGSASNADAYHTHASSPATEAPVVENTMQAGIALGIGDPVYQTSTNMRVGLGDTDTEAHAAIIGVARTAQGTVGQPIEIDCAGISLATITGMGFVAGDRIWLQNGGGLTNTTPSTSGKKIIEMGFAVNATDLFVRIIDRGKKA